MRIFSVLASGTILFFAISAPTRAEQPWDTIEHALGLKGSLQSGGVYKVALPRTDLTVARGSVVVAPTLGLTSWMAFKPEGTAVVTHGDLCLLEREVNSVLTRLARGGIETTALHNHLAGEQPRVMFLHFWGRGEAQALAETLRGALELAGGLPSPPKPVEGKLNEAEIAQILGQPGRLNAGVLQFAFPRPFPIHMHGVVLPPAMGMATALNFQPTPAGAATTGDFVLREEELSPVLQSLRDHHLEVTAIHNHMLHDSPHMVFVHFWGEGEPTALARGLRAALDTLTASLPAEPLAWRRWDFEDAALKALPSYVDAPRGRWEVEEIADAPLGSKALVQVAKSPRPYFNVAVIKEARFRDLRLTVKYKPLSGYVDQGGGVVWRYQDPDNYYLARANPLEHDFRVYRVVGGKRELFEKAEVMAPAGQWHTLSITMQGGHITCELDGKPYLEAHDDTFKNPGLVGIWTKADANTAFDELMVESYDAPAGP